MPRGPRSPEPSAPRRHGVPLRARSRGRSPVGVPGMRPVIDGSLFPPRRPRRPLPRAPPRPAALRSAPAAPATPWGHRGAPRSWRCSCWAPPPRRVRSCKVPEGLGAAVGRPRRGGGTGDSRGFGGGRPRPMAADSGSARPGGSGLRAAGTLERSPRGAGWPPVPMLARGRGGAPRRGLTAVSEPLSVCPMRLHRTGGHPCSSGTELSALSPKRPEPVTGARPSLWVLQVRLPLVGVGLRGTPRSGMQGSPNSGAGSGPGLCRSRRCGATGHPPRRRGRSWSATARGRPRSPRGFPGSPRARRSRDTPTPPPL